MEIEDKLTELRTDGQDYDYVKGYEDGHYSNIKLRDISDKLTDLRNDGETYAYINGYGDGATP